MAKVTLQNSAQIKSTNLRKSFGSCPKYQVSPHEIESLFSIEDEPHPEAVLQYIVKDSDSDHTSSNTSQQSLDYSDDNACYQPQQSSPSISFILQTPLAPVYLFPTKFTKPIKVIVFFDRGAIKSILNPEILPLSFWKPHQEHFQTTSNNVSTINLISHPITVQIFPGCYTTHKFLGSSLLGKDMILGFDIYTKLNKLRILPEGTRYKS